jgi:hypothetical protein
LTAAASGKQRNEDAAWVVTVGVGEKRRGTSGGDVDLRGIVRREDELLVIDAAAAAAVV